MSVTHVTPMTNIADGDTLGYKYLDFGEDASRITMNLLVAQKEKYSDGYVEIWLDAPSADSGEKIGTIEISEAAVAASTDTETGTDGSSWTGISSELETEVSGVHGIYFVFAAYTADASICDLDSFSFSR